MTSSQQNILSGVFAATLTPLKSDLTCDIQKMTAHCKELLNRGCSGIVLFGTTGEGTSFSTSEKIEMLHSLINAGLKPQQLILTSSSCIVSDTVELAQEGIKQGCAALLVVPPFFYKKIDDAGVIAFYREVIKRVNHPDLKIILYHIPQLSGVPFTAQLVKQLHDEFPKQIIGIKESEGNLKLTREILEQIPGFKVFVGNETQLTEAVRHGASGCIAGMANLFPELLLSLYTFGKDSSQKDDNEKIRSIRDIINQYPFIAASKGIMESQQGDAWHALRLPLIPLRKEQKENLVQQLANY